MTLIALINHSTTVPQAQLDSWISALNTQITRDFAYYYGARGIVYDATGKAIPPTAWQFVLVDHSDVQGALGYHYDDTGVPAAVIACADVIAAGDSVSVTLSHEILEALADPGCEEGADLGGGLWVAWEVCDPCEADTYGYKIGGVEVSDFVLPEWFRAQGHGPFDFCRHMTKPLSLLPGGYVSVQQNGQWTQKVAGASARAASSARHAARVARQNREATQIEG